MITDEILLITRNSNILLHNGRTADTIQTHNSYCSVMYSYE